MQPHDEISTLKIQALLAVCVPYVIEWMKKVSWIPIDQDTTKWNKAISAAIAVVTSAGLAVTLEGNWDAGGRLIIGFPAMREFATNAITSFIGQQLVYDLKIQKKEQTLDAKLKRDGTIEGVVAEPKPVPETAKVGPVQLVGDID